MKKRLSPRTIRALKPGKDGVRYGDVIMDDLTPNFGVRVLGTAERPQWTFCVVVRFPGRSQPTRAAIAPFVFDRDDESVGAEFLRAARAKARDWIRKIEEHRDPRIEDAREREAKIREHANTFGAIAEDFIRDKLPGERRGFAVEREIRKEFKAWWPRPISDITDEDIIRIIRAKAKKAPASARNILGHAKRLFQWTVDQRTYGLKTSPAATIKPDALVGKKTPRNHRLSDEELLALWRAAARVPYPTGAIYKLLLLTGLRLNEVVEARWSEFHPAVVRALRARGAAPVDWSQFDRRQLVWIIPASRMKGQNDTAREHAVPLTPDMLTVLEQLPILSGGDFLFSHTGGRTAVVVSQDKKAVIDDRMSCTLRALARKHGEDSAAIPLREWRNHDLRRNVRSGLSSFPGIREEVREAVLAHARPGISGIYDVHDYLDEKRDALVQWGALLRSIVDPAPPATSNVVAFRA